MARRQRSRKGSGGTDRVPGKFLKRGAAARETSAHAREETEQRRERAFRTAGVFRFRMKKYEEAEIIILDEIPDEIPHFYEHHMRDKDGVWRLFETCPREMDNCVLCDGANGGKPSYYVFTASIIDNRPYESKRGEEKDYSRKLLPVKAMQHEDFYRLFDACMKKHGTIRGMALNMKRDDGNSSNIGKPIMNEHGEMFDMLTEDELIDEFGHDAIKNQEGKEVVPQDGYLEPFNYDEIIAPPDAQYLRDTYGTGGNQAGSRDDAENEFEGGSRAKTRKSRTRSDEDEEPRTRMRKRTRKEEPGDEPEEDDEEEELEEKPTRRRRRKVVEEEKPARRRRQRQPEPEEEPEEDDEEEEEEEPEEKPVRRRRQRATTKTRRRTTTEEELDDEIPFDD